MDWKKLTQWAAVVLLPILITLIGTRVWTVNIGDTKVVIELKARLAELQQKQDMLEKNQAVLADSMIIPAPKLQKKK